MPAIQPLPQAHGCDNSGFLNSWPLAAIYHRIARKSPYRAYTYGRRQLDRMLAEAGFANRRLFWPYPDYREFSHISDVDDPKWIRANFTPHTTLGKFALWIAERSRMIGAVIPSFGVVAGKGDSPLVCFAQRMVTHLGEGGLCSYQITGTASVLITLAKSSRIVTVPLDFMAAQRLRRAAELRMELSALETPVEVKRYLASMTLGEFEGQLYAVESLLKGRRASQPGVDRATISGQALHWLGEFQRSQAIRERGSLDNLMSGTFLEARNLMVKSLPASVGEAWGALLARLDGTSLLTTPVHGDFCLGNIMEDRAGRLLGIVDWDLALLRGLSMWDVMRLFNATRYESEGQWALAYSESAERCLEGGALKDELDRYEAALGITRRDKWCAILTYPVFQLHNKMSYGDRRGEVILEGLAPALKELTERAQCELKPSAM